MHLKSVPIVHLELCTKELSAFGKVRDLSNIAAAVTNPGGLLLVTPQQTSKEEGLRCPDYLSAGHEPHRRESERSQVACLVGHRRRPLVF